MKIGLLVGGIPMPAHFLEHCEDAGQSQEGDKSGYTQGLPHPQTLTHTALPA